MVGFERLGVQVLRCHAYEPCAIGAPRLGGHYLVAQQIGSAEEFKPLLQCGLDASAVDEGEGGFAVFVVAHDGEPCRHGGAKLGDARVVGVAAAVHLYAGCLEQ